MKKLRERKEIEMEEMAEMEGQRVMGDSSKGLGDFLFLTAMTNLAAELFAVPEGDQSIFREHVIIHLRHCRRAPVINVAAVQHMAAIFSPSPAPICSCILTRSDPPTMPITARFFTSRRKSFIDWEITLETKEHLLTQLLL